MRDILKLSESSKGKPMDAIFPGLEGNLAVKFALVVQGVLVLFFVISPLMGKLIHQGIAKFSSLVLIVCTMFVVGNLSYMGMVYVIYRSLPPDIFNPFVWILLSFLVAFSLSLLVGRYMNWYLSDNFNRAIWTQEYDSLTDDEMMPFDRRRKEEMERRRCSRHDF